VTQNNGQLLGYPVRVLSYFFTTIISGYCLRAEIQPNTGFITLWLYPFLPLQSPGILTTDKNLARDYESHSIVGFFFETTPMDTIMRNHSLQTGVNSD